MKFLAAFVNLVATASAVDLYLHQNNNCGDSSLRCNGIDPDRCCGTSSNSSPYQSVAVRGIQGGWNVQCRGYDGGLCNRLQTVSGNNGNDWICNRSNGFRYTGVGYNFVGKKRAASETECQRPDALVLADGTEYDLTSLNDDDFDSLVKIGLKATGTADIPSKFESLLIN
ncbi:hypothetical protein FDECE_16060 [Fusarium decemcellulare]|nr:hypothetical protein FDECE_16060 [Fusarium decemcellulare]